MRPQEIIARKRDGETLNLEEINSFVQRRNERILGGLSNIGFNYGDVYQRFVARRAKRFDRRDVKFRRAA
jgi:hypothetical protein